MRREGEYTILPGCQPVALQGGLCLLMLTPGPAPEPLTERARLGLVVDPEALS